MRIECVDDEGSGPAIVYLPGIGGTGAMMLPCAIRLRRRFRLLRVRYLGGESNTYEHAANQLARLLASRGVTRPVLLAESFGSGIAYELALREPNQVAALAVLNGFARYPKRAALRVTQLAAAALGPGAYAWVRRRFGVRKAMGPRWTPDMAQQDAVRRKQFDPHYSDRLGMVARLDLRARLPSLRVPVALFASDSDRIVPALACAHEMDTLLPDSSVRVLPNAGHLALPLADLDWPEWLGELHLRAAAEASA